MLRRTSFIVIYLLFLNGYVARSERTSEIKCREFVAIEPSQNPPSSAPRKVSGLGKVSTVPGEFPQMAVLGWKDEDDSYVYACGGTLISPEYVLTAAHCASDPRRGPPDVVSLGGGSLESDSKTSTPIAKIDIHPDYKRSRVYNDIALIKLASTSSNRPACLWQSPEINQSEVTAIGYGATEYGGGGSKELLKVDLEVFSKEECNSHFEETRKLNDGILDSQVCVGDHNGTKDTCSGDAGGPLLLNLKDGNQVISYVAGIISFGKACGAGSPSVATRVSSYLDWIESTVWS